MVLKISNLIDNIRSWTKRDWLDFILLMAMVAVNGIVTRMWLMRDSSPLFSDESYYLWVTTQYYDILRSPSLDMFRDFILVNEFRPPFRMLMVLPFYSVFGISRDVAVMSNIVFWIMLLYSVYLICRRLFSRDVGLLASFFIATTPIMFGLSRSYLSDFPLAAVTMIAVYFLLRTEHFTNRTYSYLLGLVVGIGILIKIESLMFVLFPILYIMYKSDIFKLGTLLKFLVKNILYVIPVILSGIFLGTYIYAIADLVIWPGNEKFGTGLMVIFIVLGIITIGFLWFMGSVTIGFLSGDSKKAVLKRNGLTYLSSIILLVYLLQYNRDIENLLIITLALAFSAFIAAKYLLMRNQISLAWKNLREKKSFKHPWINFVRGFGMVLLTTLWWYIPAGRRVIPFAIYNPLLPKEVEGGHENLMGWDSISYYFLGLLNQQIYLFFWLFLFAVVLIMWSQRNRLRNFIKHTPVKRLLHVFFKQDKKDLFIFVLLIVLPYIILSTSHIKNSRYVTPYLPAIAIITAYGLLLLKPWWKKLMVVALVVIIGSTQLVAFSFGTDSLPDEITVETPLGELLIFGQEPLGRHQYLVHPNDEDWRMEEILGDIDEDIKNNPNQFSSVKGDIKIGTVTGSHNLHWENLRLVSEMEGYNFEFFTGTSFYEQERFYDEFPGFAYMIVLNETKDKNSEWVMNYINKNGTGYLANDFILLRSYELPDGVIIEVHKRVAESTNYSPPVTLPDLL